MPQCKAYDCLNKPGKPKGKSFFRIPNPNKGEHEKERAQRWLHNIGTIIDVDNFKFGKNQLVCEDHFEPHCFKPNLKAKYNPENYEEKRKELLEDAVPTIFVHKKRKVDPDREERLLTRQNKQVCCQYVSSSFSLEYKIMTCLVNNSLLNRIRE